MSRRNGQGSPPPTVGALLRLAWLEFRAGMYERVRTAGFDDLQPMHVLLFRYPTIAGMRPGQLAEQMNISKQAVNDLLRQMEDLGYVGRERDPADGRARRITLTGKGQRLMDLMYNISSEVAEEWAERIGPERYHALRGTLVDLVYGKDEEPRAAAEQEGG